MRSLRTSAALGVATMAGSVLGMVGPSGATPNNSTYFYFAGYVASSTKAIHHASTEFTLPTLRCPRTGTLDAYPGIQISTSRGLNTTLGKVLVRCVNGAAFYQPIVVISGVGTLPAMTVVAGDDIKVSLTEYVASASVTIADLTHPASTTTTGPGGHETVIDIGVSAGTGALPRFGKINFSHCRVNHAALASLAPTAFDMVSSDGTTHITTSPLNPGGTIFTTTWVHS